MNRVLRFLIVGVMYVGATPAEAQTAKRRPAAPVVKRAQDPDVIEAGAANFAGAARFTWGDESQEVIAGKGCQMTIKSVRKELGIVVVDEQTFDMGDGIGETEPKEGATAAEVRVYGASKLTPWVTRKRIVYVDGAPRPMITERAVFLTLAVPNDQLATGGKTLLEAFASYRSFCARR